MQSFRSCAALAVLALSPVVQGGIEFYDFGLSGMQEVPPVPTMASAIATLEFDSAAMTFDLDVFIEGITLSSITGAHIHRGAFGTNGPVVVDLLDISEFLDAGDGVGYLSVVDIPLGSAFTPAQLRGSLLYVNIHTTAHPTGEIRGQVPSPSGLVPMGALVMCLARRRRRA